MKTLCVEKCADDTIPTGTNEGVPFSTASTAALLRSDVATTGNNMKRVLAENVKAVALDCVRKLDASVRDAIEGAPEMHASMYRRLVGKIMGHIHTEVLAPIYIAYPDLEPEELKKARHDTAPVLIPPEVGAKLRDVSASVWSALDDLRDELDREHEEEGKSLEVALQGSLDLIQDVQEFLRRASPGMN